MTLNNWKMIAETRSYIFRWRSPFSRRRLCLSSLLGSLSKDDGCVYGYGKRQRQRHEARILLVERGKVHVLPVKHEFPCISLPYSTNNNVKSPNLRFLRQHEHITMKQSFFVLTSRPFVPFSYNIIRLHCTRWTRRNNCEILAIALSYILDWRFRCSSRRLCLNSLVKKNKVFEFFIAGVSTRKEITVLIAQLVEHYTSNAEVMVGVAFRPFKCKVWRTENY